MGTQNENKNLTKVVNKNFAKIDNKDIKLLKNKSEKNQKTKKKIQIPTFEDRKSDKSGSVGSTVSSSEQKFEKIIKEYIDKNPQKSSQNKKRLDVSVKHKKLKKE